MNNSPRNPYPNSAYLIIGGNLGDRFTLLGEARELLQNYGQLTAISSLYETEPWGSESRFLFLNQALKLQTLLTPAELLAAIKKIEMQLGRQRRGERNEDRVIDIDILFYDNIVISSGELQIPHPRLHQRRFVLEPLCEIAAQQLHPVLGLTVMNLWETCEDQLTVKKLPATE